MASVFHICEYLCSYIQVQGIFLENIIPLLILSKFYEMYFDYICASQVLPRPPYLLPASCPYYLYLKGVYFMFMSVPRARIFA